MSRGGPKGELARTVPAQAPPAHSIVLFVRMPLPTSNGCDATNRNVIGTVRFTGCSFGVPGERSFHSLEKRPASQPKRDKRDESSRLDDGRESPCSWREGARTSRLAAHAGGLSLRIEIGPQTNRASAPCAF